MIVGVGIDLVEIARIRKAMERPRFLERILTPREIEYCIKSEQVAGRWAAKEAIYKAVGLNLGWQDIEILPNELGIPSPTIKSSSYDPARLRLNVSITHERTHAAAVAILERIVYQAARP